MGLKNYYSMLGINTDASADDIRKAFRRLALQYHPDRNPGNIDAAEARFKEINEAYEVLGNKEARWRYDSLLRFPDYSSRATAVEYNSNEAENVLEMLRKFAGFGFAGKGIGWKMPRGCGRRQGGYCHRQWRQGIG